MGYCRRLAMRVLLLFLCLGSIQCLPQKPSSLNLNMNNVKIKTQKPGGGGIIHPAFGEATHEMPEVPDGEQNTIQGVRPAAFIDQSINAPPGSTITINGANTGTSGQCEEDNTVYFMNNLCGGSGSDGRPCSTETTKMRCTASSGAGTSRQEGATSKTRERMSRLTTNIPLVVSQLICITQELELEDLRLWIVAWP